MKKFANIAIIIACIMLISGIVVGGLSLFRLDFDFTKISTDEYKTVTYNVTSDFKNISIDTDVQDITLLLSEDEECKVICTERSSVANSVTVENDTLKIKTVDNRKWYDHIGIFIGKLEITVYLPKSEFNTLEIETDTGDVKLNKDFTFNTAEVESDTGDIMWYSTVCHRLSLKTDTGDIKAEWLPLKASEIDIYTASAALENITVLTDEIAVGSDTGDIRLTGADGNKITVNTATGNIILTDVTAFESLNIKTSTGDVTFNNSDAENIYVNTDTGDVKGTLTSPKIFITDTNTGKIKVPHSTASGGICEITTATGDIEINITENQ